MQRISKNLIGETLERIYKSEHNVRFEWWFDGGFTWSINTLREDLQLDRITIDSYSQLKRKEYSSQEEFEKNHIVEDRILPDWTARGNDMDIEVAVAQLAVAVCEKDPQGSFAVWYRSQYLKVM